MHRLTRNTHFTLLMLALAALVGRAGAEEKEELVPEVEQWLESAEGGAAQCVYAEKASELWVRLDITTQTPLLPEEEGYEEYKQRLDAEFREVAARSLCQRWILESTENLRQTLTPELTPKFYEIKRMLVNQPPDDAMTKVFTTLHGKKWVAEAKVKLRVVKEAKSWWEKLTSVFFKKWENIYVRYGYCDLPLNQYEVIRSASLKSYFGEVTKLVRFYDKDRVPMRYLEEKVVKVQGKDDDGNPVGTERLRTTEDLAEEIMRALYLDFELAAKNSGEGDARTWAMTSTTIHIPAQEALNVTEENLEFDPTGARNEQTFSAAQTVMENYLREIFIKDLETGLRRFGDGNAEAALKSPARAHEKESTIENLLVRVNPGKRTVTSIKVTSGSEQYEVKVPSESVKQRIARGIFTADVKVREKQLPWSKNVSVKVSLDGEGGAQTISLEADQGLTPASVAPEEAGGAYRIRTKTPRYLRGTWKVEVKYRGDVTSALKFIGYRDEISTNEVISEDRAMLVKGLNPKVDPSPNQEELDQFKDEWVKKLLAGMDEIDPSFVNEKTMSGLRDFVNVTWNAGISPIWEPDPDLFGSYGHDYFLHERSFRISSKLGVGESGKSGWSYLWTCDLPLEQKLQLLERLGFEGQFESAEYPDKIDLSYSKEFSDAIERCSVPGEIYEAVKAKLKPVDSRYVKGATVVVPKGEPMELKILQRQARKSFGKGKGPLLLVVVHQVDLKMSAWVLFSAVNADGRREKSFSASVGNTAISSP